MGARRPRIARVPTWRRSASGCPGQWLYRRRQQSRSIGLQRAAHPGSLPRPEHPTTGAAILGNGGGASVLAVDAFAERGLSVTPFDDDESLVRDDVRAAQPAKESAGARPSVGQRGPRCGRALAAADQPRGLPRTLDALVGSFSIVFKGMRYSLDR